jgi:hypothetical protein
VRWDDFERACPELATVARERFEADELALVGTLSRDGWPRISPVEPYLAAGELLLGMIWRSRKALDLLRDPRVVVHTVTRDRRGTEGDLKLYGRARDVGDAGIRAAYCDATDARLGWRPAGSFHCFAVDIGRAGLVRFGDHGQLTRVWTPAGGLVEWTAAAPG